MLTRSNAKTLNDSPNKQVALTWQRERELVKSAIPSSLRNGTLEHQTDVVAKEFHTYGQPGRDVQIKTGVSLVNQRNTFLRAGTGFGKSRIPEVFLALHPSNPRAVVLTINPLDTLGNNQVADKARRGLSAINCTAENATKKIIADIKVGVYQFVYMSPEVFLNNPLFKRVYFSTDFQRRLILIVVDEAHMIYSWGLVESREARHSSAHLRTQDRGVFRPSYGSLSRHLTATRARVLLLSATCRPVAVEAIKENLKWKDDDVELIEGELVRPEIRLIRMPLQQSSKLGTDVQHFFAPRSVIPDSMIPRTLIYSNSQNETLVTHQAIHHARETLAERFNGKSTCVRRFHAVTGSKDKVQHIEDYAEGNVAIMACTMAVGMGCDWPHTRRVITLGRMDPSTSVQMLGRCGRDGRPGVGIMMVEATRSSGKNKVSDFVTPFKMTDDDRMDAMAITPVCLRIAFHIDNVIGHVPLSHDDPFYVEEKRRQQEEGMSPCLCSNCRPDLVPLVFEQQPHLTHDNFDHWMTAATSLASSPVTNGWKTPNLQSIKSNSGSILPCAKNEVIRNNPLLHSLAEDLSKSFISLYKKTFPEDNCYVRPHHMLTEVHTWKIIKNFELVRSGVNLREIFGSEPIKGTFQMIQDCLARWALRDDFSIYLVEAKARSAKAAISAVKRAENKKRINSEIDQNENLISNMIQTPTRLTSDINHNKNLISNMTQIPTSSKPVANAVQSRKQKKRRSMPKSATSNKNPSIPNNTLSASKHNSSSSARNFQTGFLTSENSENVYQYAFYPPNSAPTPRPTRLSEPLKTTKHAFYQDAAYNSNPGETPSSTLLPDLSKFTSNTVHQPETIQSDDSTLQMIRSPSPKSHVSIVHPNTQLFDSDSRVSHPSHLSLNMITPSINHHSESSNQIHDPDRLVSNNRYGSIYHGHPQNQCHNSVRVVSCPNSLQSGSSNVSFLATDQMGYPARYLSDQNHVQHLSERSIPVTDHYRYNQHVQPCQNSHIHNPDRF